MVELRNAVEQQQGVVVCPGILDSIVHECGCHTPVAGFWEGIDARNTASGKPGASCTQQAFINPVGPKQLAIAICTTHLLRAIARRSSDPAQPSRRHILW